MTILAVDSSSRHRVMCAMVSGDGALIKGENVAGGTVSGSLVQAAQRCLDASRPAQVAVVTGPGSFTGLRAGMAVALGVAHALGLPLYGISTFAVGGAAALATGVVSASGTVEVVCDAGRGFVYTATVEVGEHVIGLVMGPRRLRLAEWAPGPCPVVSLDAFSPTVAGLVTPAAALEGLSRAAMVAVRGTPLGRGGLAPTYVDDTAENSGTARIMK